MQLREHEFPETDGNRFCLHCGALDHESMTATCLGREVPESGLMPEPARRVYASEDFGTIGARLAELMAAPIFAREE